MERTTYQEDYGHKNNGPLSSLEETSSLDAATAAPNSRKEGGSSSHLDYDDFPLDDDDDNEEEYKEDYFDSHFHRQSSMKSSSSPSHNQHQHQQQFEESINNNNNNPWFELLNLPPANATTTSSGSGVGVLPVGGMRRVSSCYFSIASNDNSYFHSPNPSYHHGSSYDALSFDGRNTSDFLLHDVLMNVFSFLDGRSLASFSETAKRPNFECFYFLELQLQRALLMGEEGHGVEFAAMMMEGEEEEVGGNGREEDEAVESSVEEEEEDTENHSNSNPHDDQHDNKNRRNNNSNIVPSFEGAIAGTGVISRLASLNSALARKIVQTYLDSNASIHAMPLSHSLAYFRQVLLRQMIHPSATATATANSSPSFPQPNARNMALFFTFLGAAYMHAQQGGGDIPAMPPITMPDPSEVLNEENMEALKNMMLKVGLAGGMFFKAGKTMKEKAEQQQQTSRNDGAGGGQDEGGLGRISENASSLAPGVDNNEHVGDGEDDAGRRLPGNNMQQGDNHIETNASAPNLATVNDIATSAQRRSQQRSSSLGSLEDLSHMIPHPSVIASRLYNAFSSNSNIAATSSSPNTSTANLDASQNTDFQEEQEQMPSSSSDDGDENTLPKKRLHRSKRSHKTLPRHGSDDGDSHQRGNEFNNDEPVSSSETKSSVAADTGEAATKSNHSPHAAAHEEQKTQEESLSPEAIAYAMDHPFSHNPYDHASSFSSANVLHADKSNGSFNHSDQAAAAEATSFFSFNNIMDQPHDSSNMSAHDNNVVPTGCIGAYAHAVKSAASEVMRLIKAERKANYEALPPTEQHELGMRFIDACTTDETLHIVKQILPRMDVDRFFIGRDDTETCALHAAAFNGAGEVLQFLCGGIDEHDPNRDCGLCDVNVRDANGWTALHFAAGSNSVSSVRVLSEHGAKLTIEASNGYTPFHWAERLSNEEVAAELERLGADNRFVGRWMFGNTRTTDERKIPFVSFLANRFFAFSR